MKVVDKNKARHEPVRAAQDLLVEIGTEELPPRSMRRLSQAFASAVGDAFVDDLVVYSDTDDRTLLQVIWFALNAGTSDRARAARRDLETRPELDWVPPSMRVRS